MPLLWYEFVLCKIIITCEELLYVPAFEVPLEVQQMKVTKNEVCL
jgi:hypothetical protein